MVSHGVIRCQNGRTFVTDFATGAASGDPMWYNLPGGAMKNLLFVMLFVAALCPPALASGLCVVDDGGACKFADYLLADIMVNGSYFVGHNSVVNDYRLSEMIELVPGGVFIVPSGVLWSPSADDCAYPDGWEPYPGILAVYGGSGGAFPVFCALY